MENPISHIQVAVVSDDRLLCDLLRVIGAASSFPMGNDHDAAVVRAALRAKPVDVLLMDSRVEGTLALCSALKRDRGPAVIFFMAARDDDAFAVAALAAGARGILARTCPAEDLAKAIRIVYEGQIWARRQVLEARVEQLSRAPSPTTFEPSLEGRLSQRENEVFRQAATGLSNKELAGALVISEATVKAHLTSIFQKLGLRGRAELAAAYHGLRPASRGPVAPRQLGRPA